MTNNKTVNLIIAIILAILLWTYVMGEVNPSTSATVKDVTITIENEDALESENYSIISQDITTVSVKVSGQRSVINGLKDGDITATCDVGSLGDGEYRVGIDVIAPEGVTIDSISSQTVKFVVNKNISSKKSVSFKIINDTSTDTEPYIVQNNYSDITVTGPSSYVNSIVSLQATIDAAKLTTELQTYSITLIPVNESGNEVTGVTLKQTTISVAALILGKKTVALDIPVEGESDEEYTRTITNKPRVITIKGYKSTLDSIDSVTTETVNISELTETTEIKLVPILPEDVEVSVESENLTITITVNANATAN